jgi:hypothetical protein
VSLKLQPPAASQSLRGEPQAPVASEKAPVALEQFHQYLRVLALEALAKAMRSGVPLPLRACVRDGDTQTTVTVEPVPLYKLDRANLTPCERDIITVLHEIPNPATTSRILDALEERALIHGESTVKHALADLVKRGWLIASKKAPRGYRVVEDGPCRPTTTATEPRPASNQPETA